MARIPISQISGFLTWESREKWHLGAAPMASDRECYKEEGNGFPQVHAVVSVVNMPMTHPCTKNAIIIVATPLWAKCEGEAHTPKSGNLESSRTPENSELELKGQNTLHWSFLGFIGKVLKCRCLNWPRIGHLDICSPSYGQKKGWESNWQFDSRPLKVGNRLLPDVFSRSATWRWKSLKESYNFCLNLVPIRTWGEKLWTPKVPRVQTGTVSGLQLGSPGKKNHLDVAFVRSCRKYYKGEGGGFPWVRAVVSQVSPS